MRKLRIEYPGALFHVIARGNQRQKVFLDDGDYVRYLKKLGEHLEERDFALYAYCLMDNHVHLLMEQRSDYPLSKYMHCLQSGYTTFFNIKHHKVGHLFQGRYKAILVDKDSYLLELVRYIHLNPHRAHLEKADKYPWNSHRQYLGKDRFPLARVRSGHVLPMFSKARPLARRLYVKYLDDGLKDGSGINVYDLRGGRILGDEEFEIETYGKAGMRRTPSMKLKTDLNGLWKALLNREKLSKEPVGHQRSRLAAEAAFLAVEVAGFRQKEVSDYFGMEPSAVSVAVKRLAERWARGQGSQEALLRWVKNSEL